MLSRLTNQSLKFSSSFLHPTGNIRRNQRLKTRVNRQAILIFADPTGLDLARRRLPRFLRPLLSWRRLQQAPASADFHLFTSGKLAALPGCKCHQQHGATFAERLEAAAAKLASLGYAEIVIVGSDCPSLTTRDVANAFAALTTQRLVLGPDHRGGCYLIALRAEDRALLHDVRWNRNCDYDQLRRRVASDAVLSLPVKQDIDGWADIQLLARAGHRLAEFCMRVLVVVHAARSGFVDLSAQAWRVRGQRPPPAWAA